MTTKLYSVVSLVFLLYGCTNLIGDNQLARVVDSTNYSTNDCNFISSVVAGEEDKKEKIDAFKSEYSDKKPECSLLILQPENDTENLTIAGIDKEGWFKSVSPDKPANETEISKELNGTLVNERKIANLAKVILGFSNERKLVGAWHKSNTETLNYINENESITLILDNCFYGQLPDVGQSNEVAIVLEFNEGGEKITKILGPFAGTADNSFCNQIGSVIYGPKKLDAEFLKINIKVIEIDIDENEDQKGFIDFVKNIANPLFLANPVTSLEIKLATEIAKTLIDLNQNDIIINFEFTLSAKPSKNTLPLAEGIFALVNRTKIRGFDSDYFYFTNNEYKESGLPRAFNPFSITADLLLVPYVAINSLTDSASPDSRRRLIESSEGIFSEKESSVFLSRNTHELVKNGENGNVEPFMDKAWMVFSLHSMYETISWETLKSLQPAQELLERITHQKRTSEILKVSGVNEVIDKLKEAKNEINGVLSPILIPVSASPPYEFSVRLPGKQELESISYFDLKTISVSEPFKKVPMDDELFYTFKINTENNSKLIAKEYKVNFTTKSGDIYSYKFKVE